MKLEDVPDRGRIFIDANILIYHFSGISSECRSFLARCESGQVEAFTDVHIVMGLTDIATHDSDLMKVSSVTVYQPEDIP